MAVSRTVMIGLHPLFLIVEIKPASSKASTVRSLHDASTPQYRWGELYGILSGPTPLFSFTARKLRK